MMQAEIAVLRFGLGAKPGDLAAAADEPRAWLMAQVRGPAPLAVNTPLAPSDQVYAGLLAARDERRQMKQESAAAGADAKAAFNAIRQAYQPHYRAQVLARAQSAALTARPFAERLVHFWSNHFAVSADKGVVFGLAGTLENEAIRPHFAGRFVDLLTAVEQHPAMIAFLDNQYSVGKESTAARFASRPRAADFRQPKRQFGINENLAREILELHTLGVNGGYSQADVTSFAQIITGWSIGGGKGRLAGGVPGRFYFRDNLHEPGPKVFLGKTYAEQGQRQGEAVLADLARRPETANFIATKLVRHFIADDPPKAAVDRVARAFLKTGGDLPRDARSRIDVERTTLPDAFEQRLTRERADRECERACVEAGFCPVHGTRHIRSVAGKPDPRDAVTVRSPYAGRFRGDADRCRRSVRAAGAAGAAGGARRGRRGGEGAGAAAGLGWVGGDGAAGAADL